MFTQILTLSSPGGNRTHKGSDFKSVSCANLHNPRGQKLHFDGTRTRNSFCRLSYYSDTRFSPHIDNPFLGFSQESIPIPPRNVICTFTAYVDLRMVSFFIVTTPCWVFVRINRTPYKLPLLWTRRDSNPILRIASPAL